MGSPSAAVGAQIRVIVMAVGVAVCAPVQTYDAERRWAAEEHGPVTTLGEL
jgi:hypothetical protein